MNAVKVTGNVDENHQLSAEVPATIPPGPITVWIVPMPQEDEWGEGLRRCAGALADIPGLDEDMEQILRERRTAMFREVQG
jgi:hypothetical protein